MLAKTQQRGWAAALAIAGAAAVLVACQSMSPMMGEQQVTLTGGNEVPAVTTPATGTGTVTIKDDRSVSARSRSPA